MASKIVNEDWEKIFEKFVDVKRDINIIHSKSIKENSRKDLRLMTKFDTYGSQPEIFKKNGYFLLPLKVRGNFYLIHGEGFQKVEKIDGKPGTFLSRHGQDLQSLTIGGGESKYLDYAFHCGLIEDFVGISGLRLTIRGRKTTPEFSFMVGEVGPIRVKSAQMEVDAGYESISNIVIFEGKVGDPTDFNIRQLYYPYRSWSIWLPKKDILTLFFAFNPKTETYSFWKYKFMDDQQFNSIELEEKEKYVISTPPQERISLAEVAERKEGEKAVVKEWDIPQADDFEKVSSFPFCVSEGKNDSRAISDYFGFTMRQASYYRHAAESLGLVRLDREKNTYTLTKIGARYISLNSIERNSLLSGLLFKLPIIEVVLDRLTTSKNNTISLDEIADVIGKNTKYNRTTSRRRAQTVISWFKWMEKTLGIVKVRKNTVNLAE
jgi:hypothetical protein